MDCFNCGGNWPPPLEYFFRYKGLYAKEVHQVQKTIFLVLYSVNRPAVNVISVIVLY